MGRDLSNCQFVNQQISAQETSQFHSHLHVKAVVLVLPFLPFFVWEELMSNSTGIAATLSHESITFHFRDAIFLQGLLQFYAYNGDLEVGETSATFPVFL